MRGLIGIACSMVWGILSFASGLSLVPSTSIPDPGREITLQVVGAPVGAQFRWDFNGDGRPDATTNQPWTSWTVPAGHWEVVVDVMQAGKSLARLSTSVVADARLGAVRSVRWVGGVAEVTIVVRAKQYLVALGLAEDIPPGWGVGAVEGPDLSMSQGGVLYALWSMVLDPGSEVYLRYCLYPPTPGAAGRLSGVVSAYWGGRRVEARVAGAVSF